MGCIQATPQQQILQMPPALLQNLMSNHMQIQGYPNQSYQNYPQPQLVPVPANSQIQNSNYKQLKELSTKNQKELINIVQNLSKQQTEKLNQNSSNKNIIDKKKQKNIKIDIRRGLMLRYVDNKDNFLDHHLKNQMHLCKYANSKNIKKRQIIQHVIFQSFLARGYYPRKKNQVNVQSNTCKAFFQRVMLQTFEQAEIQLFIQKLPYQLVRSKIVQKLIFQLYQTKQFLDAGLGKYCYFVKTPNMQMISMLTRSDHVLFPILQYLKRKYPQITSNTQMNFPQIQQKTGEINLLNHFQSQCFQSPKFINIKSIFNDLKFLVDRSIQQFEDFKKDMQQILGIDVSVDYKVKKLKKDGFQLYNASAIRRILIKWVQVTIQKIPQIVLSQEFLQFVKAKSIIANNFQFKSTVQQTTHSKVIQVLCQLLDAAKYDQKSNKPNNQFGFYIYDLLRCKIKRPTINEVCALLQKMKNIQITSSKKKFEVVRVRNRFKSVNRDIMVNFRYGEILVAQAQLGVDAKDISQKDEKNNKLGHYCYQIQRGIFGPTCELIMQYQDFQRRDIMVDLQAEGQIKLKKIKKPLDFLKKVDRKCFNGHTMIQLKGNYRNLDKNGQWGGDVNYLCDFCDFSIGNLPYHHCYYCSMSFCTNCIQNMNTTMKDIQLRCNIQSILPQLKLKSDINLLLDKNPIIIFYLKTGSSSVLYRDAITLQLFDFIKQNSKLPAIYSICCDGQDAQQLLQQYGIKQFPTTILFDKRGSAQITMIGASLGLIYGIFQAQKNLNAQKPKTLKINCWCQKPMMPYNNANKLKFQCSFCQNDCIKYQQKELNEKNFKNIYVCQGNHAICLNCGFLADPKPCKYKDYKGVSYLIERKYKPKISRNCPQGHETIYINKIDQTRQIQCVICKDCFVFNNILGANYCKICNCYCCFKCIGIDYFNLNNVNTQLINHTVESTAEQGQLCTCGKLFKKVYHSRDYSYNVQQNKVKIQKLISYVFKPIYQQWNCIICNKTKKDGQLHLACFNCPKYLDTHHGNLQICIDCAISQQFLNRPMQKKITQVPTNYQCFNNHEIIRTTLGYQSNKTTFQCIRCQKNFYVNTERYYCKKCRMNICMKCSNNTKIVQMRNKKPPKCIRRCKNDHDLSLHISQKWDEFRLCDGCRKPVRKIFFVCRQQENRIKCDFDLCLKCAVTPEQRSGKNVSSNDMAQINNLLSQYKQSTNDQNNRMMRQYQKYYQQQLQEQEGNSNQQQNGYQVNYQEMQDNENEYQYYEQDNNGNEGYYDYYDY